MKKRLVVIPNDPIELYERSGHGWFLERYFNPRKMFDEVFAVSPLETRQYQAYGMTIVPAPDREFHSILRELRPDLVRAYSGSWPADLGVASRVPGVPLVVSLHDTHPGMLHQSIRFADLIFCVSASVECAALACGVDRKRIRRLPNRVDRSVFHPVADMSAIESVSKRFPPGKYILHVGRKTHQKNIDTVVRALQLLPAQYAAVFVGMGDPQPYIALAATLGVEQRCFWVETVQNHELPAWYAWSACMCTPSRWEGFGIVFIEAAACGAAIITSDIGPMNEFLTNDVSACLVKEYESPAALAGAIHRVCEDRPYRTTIQKGAIDVAEPYDRPVIDSLEAALYDEAMRLGPVRGALREQFSIMTWKLRRQDGLLGKMIKKVDAFTA